MLVETFTSEYGLFIDGTWSHASDGRTIDVLDPALGERVAVVARATRVDLRRAVEAAKAGLAIWRNWRPEDRGKALERAASILQERAENEAVSLTREAGKTFAESRAEFQRAVDALVWAGRAATDAYRRRDYPATGLDRFALPEPIGVAALFTPWNYPAVVVARKIGSALAAGCSAILKPSEETPGAAVAIVNAIADAGVPAGVVGLVFGDPAEVSTYFLAHPAISVLSFTGSTAVGKQLARLAADTLKRCVLELGGHCPVIVCGDANVETAVAAIAAYKFENAGQSCNAPSRIYVDATIYDLFVERFVEVTRRIVVGNGLEPATTMGPLSSARRIEAVVSLVSDAVAKGAKVALGGKRFETSGYFYEPTILLDVPQEATIMHEEPFGPVAPIFRCADLDEAIARSNDTPYGLASYVFSSCDATASYVADRFQAGSVGINGLQGVAADAPVAGVGDSGYGYEGGMVGIDAFLNLKLVSKRT